MTQPPVSFQRPQNRWSDAEAAGLTPEGLLLYRSNLLGADLTVTNFGGGNTSAKLDGVDPLTGAPVKVLWVKGSGGDLGSMGLDGFATVDLARFSRLEGLYPGPDREDEMVDLLAHCVFNLNPRPASIDTPLHGHLPFAHIDHVHPDAVIALAASSGGPAATQAIYGESVGWIEWRRPGFELSLRLRDLVAERPGLRGVILAGHGLICWGEDSQACYANTIDLIARAADHLNAAQGGTPVFGGPARANGDPDVRRREAAAILPRLRALVSDGRPKVGHFSDDAATMQFVDSHDLGRLAPLGTSCPDHFLRTKVAPLVLDPNRLSDQTYLAGAFETYRQGYRAYYERCARLGSPPVRDANPVVVLIPGIGRITFAADKTTARLAGEFYGNAVNVMRGAEAIGDYLPLPEQEAFDIEYWALEEAKLRRMPPPRPLTGRVAAVTGAAGGIGAATAARLLKDGACVLLLDRDAPGLEQARTALVAAFGADRVRAAVCDVTDATMTKASMKTAALEFGGIDILVANAGLATSASVEETTEEGWDQNYGVLVKGVFMMTRAALPLMRLQKNGAIIVVGSKNALASTPNASAYASAKAAALHFARCLALETAADGIRVNVVNPDAVLKGSRIWDGEWREERARAYGVSAGAELEDYYRARSMLKREVLPEDVAEAIAFFAGETSGKSTGNILNVDGGNAAAFPR